jgi:phosphoglycerate kinase
MIKMTVTDIDVTDKRVLVRVDFNVPLDNETGKITDDSRIRAALPTIRYLIERGAKTILCSHLGRPNGKVVDKLRMRIVGQRLSQIMGQPVLVATDCIGSDVEKAVAELGRGDTLLLENLRFHVEEEGNDSTFAQALSRLADIYVNDAFGASHRAHASIVGITGYLPSVCGLLVEKELRYLSGILQNPARPFAVLLGGAKVSDKVAMLENLMDKVDCVLIGGGMAATFLRARHYETGQSLVEPDRITTATSLMEKAIKNGARLLLPVDVLVADEVSPAAKITAVTVGKVSLNAKIVDIGSRTVEEFSRELAKCRTIFWNGPMGVYEVPAFAEGTKSMVRLLASLDAITIIGGGSTAEIVTEMNLAEKISFVSTGGGASLRFLSGQALPGIRVLPDRRCN